MKKKAVISITSVQNNDEKDCIEVVTPGELRIGDGVFEVRYDETEISGMKGTKTKLLIKDDFIKLKRDGSTTAEMEFQKDNKFVSLYNTPYGMLELKINTKDLKVDMSEKGGNVKVKYDLVIEGQEPQNTELKINIRA